MRGKTMAKKKKVLFLCTGNSCRSQMAEGWANALKGEMIEAFSAGVETHGLNPLAVKIMAEAGVDISGQRSKLADELRDVAFDAVITLCGHARESCPYFPGNGKIIHKGFDDPPRMARELAEQGNDGEAQLDRYRRVRDQIKAFVETLPESLGW
jgi:arsenate reductase